MLSCSRSIIGSSHVFLVTLVCKSTDMQGLAVVFLKRQPWIIIISKESGV